MCEVFSLCVLSAPEREGERERMVESERRRIERRELVMGNGEMENGANSLACHLNEAVYAAACRSLCLLGSGILFNLFM